MNYQKISKFDTANGPGIRVVLWVSGCKHHCKGCQNPDTWDFNSGLPFTEKEEEDILFNVHAPFRDGITFSGGDPLGSEENIRVITDLARKIKETSPNKTIWCYTGHVWEDVKHLECMKYFDVLVDGRYDESQRDITQKYCGSKNQRIIDVKEALRMDLPIQWWKKEKKPHRCRPFWDKR